MGAEHYIVVCSVCVRTISQCRCAATDKARRYEVCPECKALLATASPEEKPNG